MLCLNLSLILALLLSTTPTTPDPVHWSWKISRSSANGLKVILTADLAPGWHIYSQTLKAGGPQPTEIRFHHLGNLVSDGGAAEEGISKTYYDDNYDMEVKYFEKSVDFIQTFKGEGMPDQIGCKIFYMVCDDERCIPREQNFVIQL